MTDRPWLAAYPAEMPKDIDRDHVPTLVQLLNQAFIQYADRTALHFMGATFSYRQLDQCSTALAAYLQTLSLTKGDRVALMMPNVPQYAVAVAAVLRAGLVVVNVNPLYTSSELDHQLKDSGAKLMIVLENFGATVQNCPAHRQLDKVIVCSMGDMLGFLKGNIVNWVVRHSKKLVPPFQIDRSIAFNDALREGERHQFSPVDVGADDIAALQYTGGTTGVAKGAVLLHRNLGSNVMQVQAWYGPALKTIPAGEQPLCVCALPLYHIFAFTVCFLLSMRLGHQVLLIPNPRDMKAVLGELGKYEFHTLPAVNTLFNGLMNHPDFDKVNWKNLRVVVGGGAAVQHAVAERWLQRTGQPIVEGYGLSETSPVASCNIVGTGKESSGSIGYPMPGTDLAILDDLGHPVAQGERGEVCIRGPQVMAGYWQRPDETAKAMTEDGFFRSGDIGIMEADGMFRIVDRKKDMVLVSGFNVYPNEVEDVAAACPGVAECAVVGVPDEKTGEAIKLVVVRKSPDLTEAQLRAFCAERLTGYKRPKYIDFRDALPKTPVGKILRRELRDETPKA
ncbi:long-chain acyl-CoA synthetase [Comamonas odontotermitis]|uniref:Long-chain-fatty-acid--CoA ligase n=1 Tax=Comamonas odontotermitis TaxID=379895 RepID=A0ABR6RAQ4_9BURK|nr:AMP-binding protein [Comamonas odontotermitis]MBB6576129.1 long-chain acyl-CoA synthetase [Comamonas odontotermitis]